jgi:glycosyltransferase involved in cell wall biosynthesis
MNPSGLYPESPNSIALIGNYLPRQCGIATFTTDLLEALATEAPEMDCWAMVMNDVPEGYPYPNQVRFELNDWNLADHGLAADFLNMNRVDTVCLQHEFGIFGGNSGSHILELLRNLRMPVITTLHTVLREPDPEQKAIFQELGSVSDRLVVMSHKAEEILKEVYGMPHEKIIFIHHGIPDVPFVDPNYYKEQFGVEGRKVILTFGLISPRKSIEDMIDALPAIVSKHPETAYIVLGATHPNVIKKEGESYRLSLQLRAREKGVEDHLIFHNRFVHLTELCEFLGAADIYATLYFNREQAVSGTLAYALGAGKAVISTPYPYAEEMLNHGRGRIVPPHDSDALAAQVIDLFDNEVERHAMRKRAYTFSRNMIWKEVARRYLELFIETKNEREQHPRIRFRAKTLSATPPELPQLKLRHLNLLTDDVGILQHAKFIVPQRCDGYCTDDNAQALIAVMMAQELLPDDTALTDLTCRYLGFLYHALNDDNGRFRNFMGYDRTWLEEQGSEDCHGRAIWSLGMAVALSTSESFTGAAMTIFERALRPMVHFRSPRAWAFGLVGIHAYLKRFGGDTEARRVREVLANALFDQFQVRATDDWPWIEDTVNYTNARIPQALLLSGRWLHREDMINAGLRSLDWLVQIQTDPKGHFVPIGNHGWFTRDGQRARFDQQPQEAQNMIEACTEAYRITGERKWTEEARRCFDWFLGRNDLNVPLYDYRTGGCCDGLIADGANQNQGAKSTLAWLLSLLSLHSLIASEASTAKPEITREI